jgi:hypothetical protein
VVPVLADDRRHGGSLGADDLTTRVRIERPLALPPGRCVNANGCQLIVAQGNHASRVIPCQGLFVPSVIRLGSGVARGGAVQIFCLTALKRRVFSAALRNRKWHASGCGA